jgi:hypothetical protein
MFRVEAVTHSLTFPAMPAALRHAFALKMDKSRRI